MSNVARHASSSINYFQASRLLEREQRQIMTAHKVFIYKRITGGSDIKESIETKSIVLGVYSTGDDQVAVFFYSLFIGQGETGDEKCRIRLILSNSVAVNTLLDYSFSASTGAAGRRAGEVGAETKVGSEAGVEITSSEADRRVERFGQLLAMWPRPPQ